MLFSTVNTIEFGKLGIGPLKINRVAFSILGLDIYWYAIIITTGLLLAILFASYNAKKVGLTSDNVLDIALIGIPTSVIGARFFYVIFELDSYDSFWQMLDIRDGGLAIYGAVIVAFIVGFFYCRHKKIDPLALFDLGAMGFMIGQTIGRWGNFMNAEAHGGVTDSLFGMSINNMGPYHPTFLYESLWNLVGFVLIYLFFRFIKKKNGEVTFLYFFWYGLGRFVIEEMRTDSLYLGDIKINRLLAIVFSVLGLALFILLRTGLFEKIFKKKKVENYEEVYKPLTEEKVDADRIDEVIDSSEENENDTTED